MKIWLVFALVSVFAASIPKHFADAASLPGIMGPAKSDALTEPVKAENEKPRLQKLLKEARRDFDKLNSPGGLSSGAPPGTSERSLLARRLLSRLLVKNYDQHLAELEKIDMLRRKRAEISSIAAKGVSFVDTPPYSVLMVEGLREQVQVGQARIAGIEKSLELADVKIKTAEESVRRADVSLRRLADKAEMDRNGEDAENLAWAGVMAELERKVFASQFAAQQATRRSLEEELLVARLEFTYLEKRVEAAEKDVRFSEEDLKLIRKRFDERKQRLQAELERAMARNQVLRRRNMVALGHQDVNARTGLTDKEQSGEDLRKNLRFDMYKEELTNSDLEVEVIQNSLDMARFGLMIWETRYLSEAKNDTKSASEIIRIAPRMIKDYERQVQAVAADLKLLLSLINERESQLTQPGYESVQDELNRLIEVLQQREKLQLAEIRDLEEGRSVFARLQDQYSDATRKAAATAKLKYWKFIILEQIGNIWKFELFTTEDVVVVDGREVKERRGITVGKTVVAVLILLIGYLVCSRLTRKLAYLLIRRYGIQDTTAMLARRWAMAVILFSLLLFSLNLVRIPLTAFAFLGGAIALGAGFGMQVLLKNLMSGLMLLAERPFRIGDMVDVDGIRGRVTSIGIRSSTIRDAAGIETLIPNSTFVEKNVTNWTYSSHQVRYTVAVGVVYGSDISEVKKRLLEVAGRHGQVLKAPEPLVALDDFAADSLLFGLYYWIDLDGGGDPRVISSDLRMMIEKSLTAADIVIAFPQRDVHLDTAKPIQVEVVQSIQSEQKSAVDPDLAR